MIKFYPLMTREGDLHVAGSERMRSRSVIKVVFLCQKDVIIKSPKQKCEKLSKDPQSSPEA